MISPQVRLRAFPGSFRKCARQSRDLPTSAPQSIPVIFPQVHQEHSRDLPASAPGAFPGSSRKYDYGYNYYYECYYYYHHHFYYSYYYYHYDCHQYLHVWQSCCLTGRAD